jgi:hypothetical protein
MIICAAGDVHEGLDRLFEDVLAFEGSLGVRFEGARSTKALANPKATDYQSAADSWLDSPVYDETQAERTWGRMIAAFEHPRKAIAGPCIEA